MRRAADILPRARQLETSATCAGDTHAGHPVHLTVSDTQVWALGDHRLTAIQAR
jgi:hypothetical protein